VASSCDDTVYRTGVAIPGILTDYKLINTLSNNYFKIQNNYKLTDASMNSN